MTLLALVGIGFVGTVLWFINTEATAVVYHVELGWNPVLIATVLSLSQNGMYVFLYHGGGRMVERWRWLGKRVERARVRYARMLEKAYLPSTFVAAIFGLPPVLAMVTLAQGFGYRRRQIFPLTLVGRFIRFFTLAMIGETLFLWWQSL